MDGNSIIILLFTLFLIIGEAYFLSLDRLYNLSMESCKRKASQLKEKISVLVNIYLYCPLSPLSSRWAFWETMYEDEELQVLEERIREILREIKEEEDDYGIRTMPSFYYWFKKITLVLIPLIIVGLVIIKRFQGFKEYFLFFTPILALLILFVFNIFIFNSVKKVIDRVSKPLQNLENELLRIDVSRSFFLPEL